jgi:lysophospholipase L1-like esterase
LQRAHPEILFVHVTIPIESMPKSLRGTMATAAKRILGRPTVIDDNASRQEYNELLRTRFGGKEPVFDLALLEALDARDRVTVAKSKYGSVQFMDRRKTSDGGHLNDVGKRFVGERLVAFLAEQVPDHR